MTLPSPSPLKLSLRLARDNCNKLAVTAVVDVVTGSVAGAVTPTEADVDVAGKRRCLLGMWTVQQRKKERTRRNKRELQLSKSFSISLALRAAQVFKWENLHLSYFTYLTHHNRCRCHSHCRCRCRCHCRRHCPNHCAPNSWAALHWLHWSSSSSASAHLPAMRWSLSSV